ncbi:MAG: recombinase family protein [Faecalimonas umbilicata]
MEKTRRSEEEWRVIENAHAPIISKELFGKVQAAMNEAVAKRNSGKKQEAPATDHRDTFREKVYCGDCGSMMRLVKG